MSAPLDELSAVIAARVDPPDLRSNLAKVSAFLDGAPPPAVFKAAIADLNTGLKTDLRGAIETLRLLLAAGSSPLDGLSDDLAKITDFTSVELPDIDAAMAEYSPRVGDARTL